MKQKSLKIISKNNIPIYSRLYYSDTKPKGIIIVCHGFGENINSYKEFAQYLTSNQYACVLYDQRGHGKMPGKSKNAREKLFGIIPSYTAFLDDIDAIKQSISSLPIKAPLILYGHSMGGNIAVNYLLQRGEYGFTCAILESPWLRLFKPIQPHLVFLAKILGMLNPNWAVIHEVNKHDISNDKKKVQSMNKDELYHNRISFRMFTGLTEAGEFAIENSRNLTIPIMLIRAEKDHVVSPLAIREFWNRANSNVILKSYKNAYHSVHNDVIKERYYCDVIQFLDSVCLRTNNQSKT